MRTFGSVSISILVATCFACVSVGSGEVSERPVVSASANTSWATAHRGLSEAEAEAMIESVSEEVRDELLGAYTAIAEAGVVSRGRYEMRFVEHRLGTAAEPNSFGKRPLWILLHGGGQVVTEANDDRWRRAAETFRVPDAVCLFPRAPTDRWDMWWRPEIDKLLLRLIEIMVVARGVDPDRVFLVGVGAGADGVYHLAGRLSDVFASAGAVSGHPNGAPMTNLRSVPFAVLMGDEDQSYGRRAAAEKWRSQFRRSRLADPEGNEHFFRFYPGLRDISDDHLDDASAWLSQWARQSWPSQIEWLNEHRTLRRHWIEVLDPRDVIDRRFIRAAVDGQTISIDAPADVGLRVLLRDELIDLDRSITIIRAGRTVFEGRLQRNERTIREALRRRFDTSAAFTAIVEIPPEDF